MSAHLEEGKSIEVATLLGDSVVDVKHCIDPHGGKITPKTWGVFAAGAACLLVSAIAFYVSVSTAAYNQGALDYWTHVANKPVHGFRAQILSTGYDWLAFGGFAMGLVACVMGLARMRAERRSPYYRIGTAPGVEQPLEGAPAASFPLVAPQGDDFVFNFGTGMTGDMMIDGKATPLAELAASGRARPSMHAVGAFELPIPMNGRIRAKIGMTSFLVTGVATPRQHTTPLLAGLESRTVSYFAGSLAAHLALVLILAQIPVDAGTVNVDISSLEQTGIKSDSTEKEDVPPEQLVVNDGTTGPDGQSAVAMNLPEGKAGTTKSDRPDGHLRMKDNNLDPQVARLQAIEEARTAGFLGSVSLQSGGAFASLTGTGNLSSGFEDKDIYGPLFGSEGEGQGYFGWGRNGFGGGGGCTQEPCGIIGGPTGYGKIGLGRFGRSGWDGPGGGGPGMRKRTPGVPGPVIGTPTGSPTLDKATIRRYIKRHIDKIGYCYEKELLAKPGIEGTVTVSFFISPTGSVKGSTGSGFDAVVANCVADVVGEIAFPAISDSGGVQVNYPFTFRPTH
jgi:hypothetical protein